MEQRKKLDAFEKAAFIFGASSKSLDNINKPQKESFRKLGLMKAGFIILKKARHKDISMLEDLSQ